MRLGRHDEQVKVGQALLAGRAFVVESHDQLLEKYLFELG